MVSEPRGTRDEASREDQDVKDRQSFPPGSIDSTVDESSQRGEWRPLAPVQEIQSRGLELDLFDEQPIVREPQPGEQFQVGDHLVQLPSDNHCAATAPVRGPSHVAMVLGLYS